MQRRGFDNLVRNLPSQCRGIIRDQQMLYEHSHHVAGASDVAAGIVIPVFNDTCHADDDVVLYLHQPGSFLLHLRAQFFILSLHQFEVLLLWGVISNYGYNAGSSGSSQGRNG